MNYKTIDYKTDSNYITFTKVTQKMSYPHNLVIHVITAQIVATVINLGYLRMINTESIKFRNYLLIHMFGILVLTIEAILLNYGIFVTEMFIMTGIYFVLQCVILVKNETVTNTPTRIPHDVYIDTAIGV